MLSLHTAPATPGCSALSCTQDTDRSDLDILIDPTPETTLMDLAAIEVELQGLLGVLVDVLTPRDLPVAFRSRALSEATPI